MECQLQGSRRWTLGATVLGPLRIPSCDQQQPNRQGGTRSGRHRSCHVHIPPQRYEFVQADDGECQRVHSSVLAACASERFSKGSSLWLCTSASQDKLGMVVDASDGNALFVLRGRTVLNWKKRGRRRLPSTKMALRSRGQVPKVTIHSSLGAVGWPESGRNRAHLEQEGVKRRPAAA